MKRNANEFKPVPETFLFPYEIKERLKDFNDGDFVLIWKNNDIVEKLSLRTHTVDYDGIPADEKTWNSSLLAREIWDPVLYLFSVAESGLKLTACINGKTESF